MAIRNWHWSSILFSFHDAEAKKNISLPPSLPRLGLQISAPVRCTPGRFGSCKWGGTVFLVASAAVVGKQVCSTGLCRQGERAFLQCALQLHGG